MSVSDRRSAKPGALAWFILTMVGLVLLGFMKDVYRDDFPMSEEAYLLQFVLTLDVHNDSWHPMHLAAVEKLANPDAGLYQTIFFEQNVKFQYPPPSLLPIMALVSFGMDWEDFLTVMNMVSLLSLLGLAWCVFRIAIVIFRRYGGADHISFAAQFVLFLAMLVGTVTFYPVIRAQYLGQVQVILDFAVALAFLLWLNGRNAAAGVLIALATIIKPQFGLLFLWAILRKEKAFAIGVFVVLAIAGIVSLAVFGWQDHLDYLAVLSYIGRHGEVFWANQSVNGILNRLISDVSSLDWHFNAYAPYNSLVYAGTLASTIGFLLFGLIYRPAWVRSNPVSNDRITPLLDMATMILLTTIASPVAWEHHYGVALPVAVIALAFIIILLQEDRSAPTVVALILCVTGYFLVASFFAYTEEVKYSHPPVNLLQSYIFFGGLLLIAALLLLRARARKLVAA